MLSQKHHDAVHGATMKANDCVERVDVAASRADVVRELREAVEAFEAGARTCQDVAEQVEAGS